MTLHYSDKQIDYIFYRGASVSSNAFESIAVMKGLPKYDLKFSKFKIIGNLKLFVKKGDTTVDDKKVYSPGTKPYYCESQYEAHYMIDPKTGTLVKLNTGNWIQSRIFKMALKSSQSRWINGRRQDIPYSNGSANFPKEYYRFEGFINNYMVDGKFMIDGSVTSVSDFNRHGYAYVYTDRDSAHIIDTDFKTLNDEPGTLYSEAYSNFYFKDNWCTGKKRNVSDLYWIAHRMIKNEKGEDKDVYNYMLSDGTYLCKKWYRRCDEFHMGVAPVCKEFIKYDGDDNKWAFVNPYGREYFEKGFAHIRYNKELEYYIVDRKSRGGKLIYNIVRSFYEDDGKRNIRLHYEDFWLTAMPDGYRSNFCIVQRTSDKRYSFLSKYLGKLNDEWYDECRWIYSNSAFLRRSEDGKCNIGKVKGYKLNMLSDKWFDDIEALKGGMFKCMDNGEVVSVMDF